MSALFPKFMQGFGAAVHLLNVAIEKRAAIECVVLLANIIDGSLRTGLILKHQIRNRSTEIDELLIRQEDGDPMISEREIYKRSLKEDVIDQILFDDLSAAYGKRNKAIHRYLLCGITYDDTTQLVFELDGLQDRIRDRIFVLEEEQIQSGVGMAVSGPQADREFLKDFAAQKERRHNLG